MGSRRNTPLLSETAARRSTRLRHRTPYSPRAPRAGGQCQQASIRGVAEPGNQCLTCYVSFLPTRRCGGTEVDAGRSGVGARKTLTS
jgi:hypothetical protein